MRRSGLSFACSLRSFARVLLFAFVGLLFVGELTSAQFLFPLPPHTAFGDPTLPGMPLSHPPAPHPPAATTTHSDPSNGHGGAPMGTPSTASTTTPPSPQRNPIAPLPVVLIPGFAGTRLNAWSPKGCMGNLGFNVGDRVWLDTAKVVGLGSCWLECMMLSPYNMSDPKDGCKIRPVQGTEAIGELDPGLITGRLTSVWQIIIRKLSENFNYDPLSLIAMPYDYRLPPSLLEKRDSYFYRLMNTIETAMVTHNKKKKEAQQDQSGRTSVADGGVIVIAHSMGNNVFQYFLEWLKHEKGMLHYQDWIDRHISAYFAVGAPLLGSIEPVKAMYTGLTFGLPISIPDARRMATTFASSAWMFPFSPLLMTTTPKVSHEWPTHAVKLIFPEKSSKNETTVADDEIVESNKLKSKTYHPKKFQQMWRDLAAFDEVGDRILHWLSAYYKEDRVMDFEYAWERPPIKKVYCVYGVNMKTELAHTYRGKLSQKPGAEPGVNDITWVDDDIIFEEGGRIYSEQNDHTIESFVPGRKSGDLTVPYSSLSWCHQWLGAHVNVTRIPQRVYFSDEVFSNEKGHSKEASITFFESPSHVITTTRDVEVETAVWEIDNADHRGVIQADMFLRELREELSYYFNREKVGPRPKFDVKHRFASKGERIPRVDEDCVWDYLSAHCKWSDYCEYRFQFGDLTLDQSCRLKKLVYQDIPSPCLCETECVAGYCQYSAPCPSSHQPFGKDGGWWGPCVTLEQIKEASQVP